MRRLIASGLAALTFAGALAAGATANAEERHHHYHHDRGGAVVAGLAGMAIGAAIAGDRGYYAPPYPYYGYPPPAYGYDYGYGYGYDYGPRRCRTFRTWDPYLGAWVERTRCWR